MSVPVKTVTKPKGLTIILAVVAAILLLVVVPITNDRRILSIACLVFIYIALGESWNLLSGLTGIFSIAHAVFFGLGTYGVLVATRKFGLPLYMGFFYGVLINIMVGYIFGKIASKLSGLYFTMAMMGLQQVVFSLAQQWTSLTEGEQGLRIPKQYVISSKQTHYFIAMGIMLLMIALFIFIRKSRMGTSLLAVKENPNLAQALGINVPRWRITATIVSACMASIVGGYYAVYMLSANPSVFSADISLKIIMVVYVGGVGHVLGPVIGSVMIILDELVRGAMPAQFAPYSVIVYALVLILMVIFKPDGLINIRLKKPLSKVEKA